MPKKLMLVPIDPGLEELEDRLYSQLRKVAEEVGAELRTLPGARGSITFVEIPDPPPVPSIH